MGFYEKYILPRGLNVAMGQKPIMKQREKVVPLAEGRVLEIGVGAGHNFAFYDPAKVEKLWALEPAEEMRALARPHAEKLSFEVDFLDLPGEDIPLDDNSADTIMITYTMCTIPDAVKALHGMRRVLKPGGRMIFCEHGKAPDEAILKWQNRLNPIWKKLGGGCNMNRDIPAIILEGGFQCEKMEEGYLPNSAKILSYNYWGHAVAR